MIWKQVAQLADIPADGPLIAKVGRAEIGIFKVNDQVVAWRNVCPHMGAPICRGTVDGTRLPSRVYEFIYGRDQEILQCPWHGREYDLLTGEHLAEGSDSQLRGYPVEVRDGEVYVQVRE